MKKVILLVCGLTLCGSLWAAVDTYPCTSEAQEQQYRHLTQSLRCPKCQNTSIAESSAMIAADMRQKVCELIRQGHSSQDIVDYMVARYGNFVTYQPPVMPSTLILWLGPLLFILGGATVIILYSRRKTSPPVVLDAQQQQRLKHLFDKHGKPP